MELTTDERLNESGGPLLTALMTLCAYHGRAVHRDTLVTGLPLASGKLTPSVFDRAARRAQFSSRVMRRELLDINRPLLPAILLLRDERVCVLTRVDSDTETAEVIYPELDDAAVDVPLTELEEQYTGTVIYCRPDFKLERHHADFGTDRKKHWFWGIISQNRALYRDIIAAAVVINLFAVAMPLFVLN